MNPHLACVYAPSVIASYTATPFCARGTRKLRLDQKRGLTWREVAERCGTRFHPLAQFGPLSQPCGQNVTAPLPGLLPAEVLDRLVHVLDRWTGDGLCWAAYWVGWGTLAEFLPLVTDEEVWTAESRATASFETSDREYVLLTGPLDAIVPPFGMPVPVSLCPQLCWPEARNWFFATEIDFDFTLIGVSDDVAAALLGDSRLEVAEVGWEDRIDDAGDRVN